MLPNEQRIRIASAIDENSQTGVLQRDAAPGEIFAEDAVPRTVACERRNSDDGQTRRRGYLLTLDFKRTPDQRYRDGRKGDVLQIAPRQQQGGGFRKARGDTDGRQRGCGDGEDGD